MHSKWTLKFLLDYYLLKNLVNVFRSQNCTILQTVPLWFFRRPIHSLGASLYIKLCVCVCGSVCPCQFLDQWIFCQIPLIISIGWPLSNYSYYQSLRPHSPCSVHLILKCDIERLDLINFFCHTSQAVLCAKVLNKVTL